MRALFTIRYRPFGLSFLFLLTAGFGQTPGTGAISGVIYDPSHRVLAGVEVHAVNEATNISRSVITTSEGVFRVQLLPPGIYDLVVRHDGFAEKISRGVQVTVSHTTS